MTIEELRLKLEAIHINYKGADLEASHAEADDALLEYINDDEVHHLYERLEKWYA